MTNGSPATASEASVVADAADSPRDSLTESLAATQQALRTTQAKLLMAAEAAGIGLWSWDPAIDLVTWEDTMCALYGRAPGDVPRTRDEYVALIHPDDREQSKQRIARGRADGHWEHEYRILTPDGATRWLASRTRVVHTDGGELVLGAVFEITERKENEERARAKQRLEVVGELTAGIAHNFNNLLMGIIPNLALALRSATPEVASLLRVAEQSAQRAAGVVRQLMTYAARRDGGTRRDEPMGPLVERLAAFYRTTLDRRISLEVQCDDSAAAHVDPSLIEQAVLNLLINARDALEQAAPAAPTIRVVVESVLAGAPELEGRAGAGDWVAIRVIDNGVGMDAATVARMYEPFFTTKSVDKGTGLGLATTQAIVRDHQGFIICQSRRGQGTAMTLCLPRSPRPAPSVSAEASEGAANDPRPRTPEAVILVVDDEDFIRDVLRDVLESSGFRVETAASGEQALARLADPSRARVDLVLLDLSMPGMSGPETRRRLAEMTPAMPVVLLTGYEYPSASDDKVLHKPVVPATLVSCLHEVLGSASRVS